MWKHKYWALEGGRVSREHQRRGKADLLPAQPRSRSCPVFPSRGLALEMLLEEPTSHTAQPHHVLHWVFHPTNAIRSLILLVPTLHPDSSSLPFTSAFTSTCASQIFGGVTSAGKQEEDVQGGKKSGAHAVTQNCLSGQQHMAGEPGNLPSEFHSSRARAALLFPKHD